MSARARLPTLVLAAAATLAAAGPACGALFVVFSPPVAHVGETISVRLGGTPPEFTPSDRVAPFQKPVDVYLVLNRHADEVKSAKDTRLTFLVRIVPDKNGNGVVHARVPDLPAGEYAAAYSFAPSEMSFGQSFYSAHVGDDVVPEFRGLLTLTIVAGPGDTTAWKIATGVLAAALGVSVLALWRLRLRERGTNRSA